MKLIKNIAITILIAALTPFSTPAQAAGTLTLIAEDSFEYSGNIVGKNGGSGFTGAWTSHYGSSDYGMNASGLTYSGLTTAGGYMYGCTATPNTVCGVAREIPLQNSGVTYIQFIAAFGSQTGGGTPMIRLFDGSGNLTGGIGANGGTYGSNISILDSTGNPPSDGSASAGTLNSTSFIILKIDYTNNVTSMWINPTLASFSYTNSASPTVTLSSFAPIVKNIAFYSRNGYSKFDELKVYNIAPTPADDSAARAEEARQRQEKIAQARAEIVRKTKSNSAIDANDIANADYGKISDSSLALVNRELGAVSPDKKNTIEAVSKVIRKYQTYEILQSSSNSVVPAKTAIDLGIIPSGTLQATYILYKLRKSSLSERNSIEAINLFVASETKIFQDRQAKLKAVKKR